MAQSIKGKVAFVTGASAGIGRATALALAAEGAALALCARTLERVQPVAEEAMAAGAAAVHAFALDVTKREQVESAMGSLPSQFQQVDILVNNAGLARGLEKLWLDDPENWEEMIDTNMKGLLYVTRAVVPGMVARAAGML